MEMRGYLLAKAWDKHNKCVRMDFSGAFADLYCFKPKQRKALDEIQGLSFYISATDFKFWNSDFVSEADMLAENSTPEKYKAHGLGLQGHGLMERLSPPVSCVRCEPSWGEFGCAQVQWKCAET
jgi:hypothetical protein